MVMKNVWQKIKKPVILTLVTLLIIGAYYYCSRIEKDNNEKITTNNEITRITSKDLELNYPSTPKAVVTYYSEIISVIYKIDMNDEELEKVASQMRGLFDEELLLLNSHNAYIDNLKLELELYQEAERYISGYKIENGYNIEYITYKDEDYAKVDVLYYLREGKELKYIYEEYTLREDEDGKWKILFWELTDSSSMEE
jgi:hypothetical protein